MRKNLIYILVVFIISCTKSDPLEYVQYLDGYWEIEKVITVSGEEKKYNFNQSIDFIEVKDTFGIRKKLKPQLDGTFITTNDEEKFKFKIENDSLNIYYSTPFANWKETVISAKENEMIIKNHAGNLYFYKKYTKMQL